MTSLCVDVICVYYLISFPIKSQKSKWIDVFTSRLSETVKMVGPVISCQAIARGGDANGDWRTNPHVTQEMVVVDKVCVWEYLYMVMQRSAAPLTDSDNSRQHIEHLNTTSTTQEGLDIVRAANEVLQCYGDVYDAKYHSESGASRAILEAGKNIDCLMLRYGSVNWGSKENWQCNGGYGGMCAMRMPCVW